MTTSGMVLIPGGTFQMGSTEGNANEVPVHTVSVQSFYLDECVVTNRQYQRFLLECPQWRKENASPEHVDQDYLNLWDGTNFPVGLDDYAVINVSWHAASHYAAWLGKRLPTEAEWGYAAGGKEHCKWSLGSQFEPGQYWFGITTDPIGFPVKTRPANSYALYEMSGGVWEWVQDYYDHDFYSRSPLKDPINQNLGPERVLRGGSCHFEDLNYLRCDVRGRNLPQACHEDYGFRCAKDV